MNVNITNPIFHVPGRIGEQLLRKIASAQSASPNEISHGVCREGRKIDRRDLIDMKPHGTRTEEIVLTTAAQSSLSNYLTAVSNLNPIYTQLRDTAWAEAQASGNLTPDPRLLANLERARSIPSKGKFALVDSGTQRLILFENAQVVDSMKVIVGTDQLPTPLIASTIYYVTYNPYWHAPDHLVRKTIAPTVLRQGMNYLRTRGYHVLKLPDSG